MSESPERHHGTTPPLVALKTVVSLTRRRPPFSFRVILVGDAQTGKTAFVEKLLFKAEQGLYFPSVLDIYQATGSVEFVKFVGAFSYKKYALTLVDTSGSAQYAAIRAMTYKGESPIIFLCFSIIDRESFESCRTKWLHELAFYFAKDPQCLLILIGTHADLVNKPGVHRVAADEARALARQLGAQMYLETGLGDRGDSVAQAFATVIHSHPAVREAINVLEEHRNDHSIVARTRVPSDACCVCHVGSSGKGLLLHSAPEPWRSVLEHTPLERLAAVRYPHVAPPVFDHLRSADAPVHASSPPRHPDQERPAPIGSPAAGTAAAFGARAAVSAAAGPGSAADPAAAAAAAASAAATVAASPAGDQADAGGEMASIGEPSSRDPLRSPLYSLETAALQLTEPAPELTVDHVPGDSSPAAGSPLAAALARPLTPLLIDGLAQLAGALPPPSRSVTPMGAVGDDSGDLSVAERYQRLCAEVQALDQKTQSAARDEDLAELVVRLEQMLALLSGSDFARPTEKWRVARRLAMLYNASATRILRQKGEPLSGAYKTLLKAKQLMEDESAFLRSFSPQRCDLLAVTYQRLAWMYRKARKSDVALGCIATAIELERRAGLEMEAFGVPPRSTSAAAHLYLSALLAEVGKYADALKEAERAIEKLSAGGSAPASPSPGGDRGPPSPLSTLMQHVPQSSAPAAAVADEELAHDDPQALPTGALAFASFNAGVAAESLGHHDVAAMHYQRATVEAMRLFGSEHRYTQQFAAAQQAAEEEALVQDTLSLSASDAQARTRPGRSPLRGTAGTASTAVNALLWAGSGAGTASSSAVRRDLSPMSASRGPMARSPVPRRS